MTDLQSRPYQTADPKHHCERCVFGTGDHAEFCEPFTMYVACELRKIDACVRDAQARAGAQGLNPAWVRFFSRQAKFL